MCCNRFVPDTLSFTMALPMDAVRMEKPSMIQSATPHWRTFSILGYKAQWCDENTVKNNNNNKKPYHFQTQLYQNNTTLHTRTLILFAKTMFLHCQHLIREQAQDNVLSYKTIRVTEHSLCLHILIIKWSFCKYFNLYRALKLGTVVYLTCLRISEYTQNTV